MHLKSYKANDARGLMNEALRTTDEHGNWIIKTCYENGHVDKERSSLNWDTVGRDDPFAYYKKRIKEVKIAKKSEDINMFSSSIVYLPEEYLKESPERQREFFREVSDFFKAHYGEENYIYGMVHNDENRPHIHCVGIPVEHREARTTKTGRQREAGDYLNCKKVDSTAFVADLHNRIDAYLSARLSWYRGGIQAENPEDRGKHSLVTEQYKEKREAEKKAKEARAEVVRASNQLAEIRRQSDSILPSSLPARKYQALLDGRAVKLNGSEATALRGLLRDGFNATRENEELTDSIEVKESAVRAERNRLAVERETLQQEKADFYEDVQQESKKLDDKRADIDRKLEKNGKAYRQAVDAINELKADRLETARMIRDFGDILEERGEELLTGFSEELHGRIARGETAHPDYRDDPKTVAHDATGERYERLREKADKILSAENEKRCKPFTKLRDMLTGLFRKMGLFNKEKERSLADTFTRGR